MECIEIDENYQKERVKSIITDIFFRKLFQKFIYNYKKEKFSYQYNINIPLLVQSDSTNIKLEYLWHNYFRTEKFEFNQE